MKELIIKTNPLQPDKPLYARFRIKTYGDTTVTATVDNPAIQVRVLPVDNWQRGPLDTQVEESEVIIQSATKQPIENVPLVLASQSHGNKSIVRLSFKKESHE